MYIYNVTTCLEPTIEKTWLEWMRTTHIPEILATKKFNKAVLTKVLTTDADSGISYAAQFTTDSKETLLKYYSEDAPTIRAKSTQFGEKALSFRTELEILAEF